MAVSAIFLAVGAGGFYDSGCYYRANSMIFNRAACRAAGGEPPPPEDKFEVKIPYYMVRCGKELANSVKPPFTVINDVARRQYIIFREEEDDE